MLSVYCCQQRGEHRAAHPGVGRHVRHKPCSGCVGGQEAGHGVAGPPSPGRPLPPQHPAILVCWPQTSSQVCLSCYTDSQRESLYIVFAPAFFES